MGTVEIILEWEEVLVVVPAFLRRWGQPHLLALLNHHIRRAYEASPNTMNTYELAQFIPMAKSVQDDPYLTVPANQPLRILNSFLVSQRQVT